MGKLTDQEILSLRYIAASVTNGGSVTAELARAIIKLAEGEESK